MSLPEIVSRMEWPSARTALLPRERELSRRAGWEEPEERVEGARTAVPDFSV